MERAITKLARWAESKGWELRASNRFLCEPNERVIYFQKQPACLPGLLHECGHALIAGSRHPRKFRRGYGEYYQAPTRLLTKADMMHEEIEAWFRGLALARRLRIKVDERRFWKEYGEAIVSYMRSLG